MKIKYSFLFLLVSLLISCSKNKVVRIASTEDLALEMRDYGQEEYDKSIARNCNDPESYIPYPEDLDSWDVKYIKVNVHVMNNVKGDQNKVDVAFVKGMLQNANERLVKNKKMKLPEGNDTPNLNPYYQYVLTPSDEIPGDNGIYFHADDSLYYYLNKGRDRNNYSREVIDKYVIEKNNVLNVFMIPFHPDSVASKTYKQKDAGIALGNELKMGGDFANPKDFWEYATLLNHEVGHVFSLRHAWTRNDGCDDTPKHNNCFYRTGKAPCDGVTSNNVMDYNNSQMAFSPCQLGRIHKVINNIDGKQRGLIRTDWCDFNAENEIRISKEVTWNGAKDLNRNIIIEAGGNLTLNCRLSMSQKSSIRVMRGGILTLNATHLHNSCGDLWEGVLVEGQGDKQGKVFYNGKVLIEDVVKAKD